MRQINWEIPGDNNYEVLIQAASDGDYPYVQSLLQRGVPVNAKGDYGWTPLHKACWSSRLKVVKLLIQNDADVNIKAKKGETPLHEACWDGSLPMVKLLIENGANPNAKDDNYGETPLHWASQRKHPDVVWFLVRQCPWLISEHLYSHDMRNFQK